jgi:hypothetical protein
MPRRPLDLVYDVRRLADAVQRIEEKLDRVLKTIDPPSLAELSAREQRANRLIERLRAARNRPGCAVCKHLAHVGRRCPARKCGCEMQP